MISCNMITALLFSALIGFSCAYVPSSGLQSAAEIRSGLRDRDFRIRFNRGIVVNTPTFKVRIADVTKFPVLGAQDVQSSMVLVTVKAGKPFIPHHHPRASETFNTLRGVFRNTFRFEGLGEVRNVSNIIRAGESTVFPQGLVHSSVCISKKDCTFLSVFNSADPGNVPV